MRLQRMGAAMAAVGLLLLGGCGAGEGEGPGASPPSTSSTTSVVTTSPTVATTSTSGAAVATAECGQVAFTPNSEDAASEITASGLTCADARRLVEMAGRRTSAGGPAAVDVDGYRCTRTRAEEDPLPVSYYRCERDGRTVTFARS